MLKSKIFRRFLLLIIILAVILIPFFLFGARIESGFNAFLQSASGHSFATMGVIVALLACDIFLPVPSSIVSTSAGFLLGFFQGFAASWVGMSAGCLIGYGAGRLSRRGIVRHLLGVEEARRLENLNRRFGDWLIVFLRPVPVLAEASVLFAGIGAMPFLRFILFSALSNAGISAVYAAVGAYSSSLNSFLLAFLASVLVPGLAMLFMKKVL